jgi:hypothetical protein
MPISLVGVLLELSSWSTATPLFLSITALSLGAETYSTGQNFGHTYSFKGFSLFLPFLDIVE